MNFVCQFSGCGAAFSSSAARCMHHKRVHGGSWRSCASDPAVQVDRPFPCSGCGRFYKSKGSLKAHKSECSWRLQLQKVTLAAAGSPIVPLAPPTVPRALVRSVRKALRFERLSLKYSETKGLKG